MRSNLKPQIVIWMSLITMVTSLTLTQLIYGSTRQGEHTTLSNAKLQSIIWTSRIGEAETFYRDVLGLTLRTKAAGALVFDVGGGDLRVSPVPSTKPSEHTVLGFAVDDVDSVVRLLGERGLAFERFDGFRHEENGVMNTPDGARVAWIRDPDGNLLSIVQFSPGS